MVDRRMVWVDFVYRPNEMVKVYFSFPTLYSEKITEMLSVKGRRKSILGSAAYQTVERDEMRIPNNVSTCELNFAYEKLFSLSTTKPIQFPDSLPLQESEAARISFCLQPTTTSWLSQGNQVIKNKMENGVLYPNRTLRIKRVLPLFLSFLRRFFGFWFQEKANLEYGTTWLSPETIKKWNDSHYKIIIRLAAPQRFLPKLVRPFQILKGENRLDLYFCPRSDNQSSIRELNKQKLKLASRQEQRRNIVSTREITTMVPFLSFLPGTKNQLEKIRSFG